MDKTSAKSKPKLSKKTQEHNYVPETQSSSPIFRDGKWIDQSPVTSDSQESTVLNLPQGM